MRSNLTVNRAFEHFEEALEELNNASSLTKRDKVGKLISQVDQFTQDIEGIEFLFKKSPQLDEWGVFENTAWQEPEKLVPQLVHGTLKAGPPHSNYEVLSELRMLAYATGKASSKSVSQREAASYLEEVLVHNLEFVFQELTEETRSALNETEKNKVFLLFQFLLDNSELQGIKDKLAEEVTLICEQRPIVTRRAREIIEMVRKKVDLTANTESDQVLQKYINAVYQPTAALKQVKSQDEYRKFLEKCNSDELEAEAKEMSQTVRATGLVSRYHAVLLLHICDKDYLDILSPAFGLSETGLAECNKHSKAAKKLIQYVVHPENAQCIFGLARMLEKGLFSRQAVRAGLDNIKRIRLDPKVETNILKSITNPSKDISALQYLIGALIRVLGQPLGIGQGNNPTCQSARGISMWSQHAPAKLINMLITAATQNNLSFRFEGRELEAKLLGAGLAKKLDYSLDAVSVVLVPLLDKVYNEMMKLASGRGEDPHKWVNPALYGQWIQMGFASVYNYYLNAIHDYDGFTRLFYAACHLDHNSHHRLVYPNPVGIFITSSRGDMIGFHAVSLLRVKEDDEGVMRAYFLNPNTEGRQDWGQEIKPSVLGHEEKPGESSLPFDQFASRVYAFHYNSLEAEDHISTVPGETIRKVKDLAKTSWGRAYIWNETPRKW